MAWRVGVTAVLSAGVALALLHAWILWDQLSSGRLLQGDSAVRWVAALGLCAALSILRRRGVSLWWGRQAFTVWLLVALLHASTPSLSSQALVPDDASRDAATTFLLPTGLMVASLGGLLLVAAIRSRRSPFTAIGAVVRARDVEPRAEWSPAVRAPRGPPAVPA